MIEALGCVYLPHHLHACTMKHDAQDILHWADFSAWIYIQIRASNYERPEDKIGKI